MPFPPAPQSRPACPHPTRCADASAAKDAQGFLVAAFTATVPRALGELAGASPADLNFAIGPLAPDETLRAHNTGAFPYGGTKVQLQGPAGSGPGGSPAPAPSPGQQPGPAPGPAAVPSTPPSPATPPVAASPAATPAAGAPPTAGASSVGRARQGWGRKCKCGSTSQRAIACMGRPQPAAWWPPGIARYCAMHMPCLLAFSPQLRTPPCTQGGAGGCSLTLGSSPLVFGACTPVAGIGSNYNLFWLLPHNNTSSSSSGSSPSSSSSSPHSSPANDASPSKIWIRFGMNATTDGWVAVGFPATPGRMIGSTALVLRTCSACPSGGCRVPLGACLLMRLFPLLPAGWHVAGVAAGTVHAPAVAGSRDFRRQPPSQRTTCFCAEKQGCCCACCGCSAGVALIDYFLGAKTPSAVQPPGKLTLRNLAASTAPGGWLLGSFEVGGGGLDGFSAVCWPAMVRPGPTPQATILFMCFLQCRPPCFSGQASEPATAAKRGPTAPAVGAHVRLRTGRAPPACCGSAARQAQHTAPHPWQVELDAVAATAPDFPVLFAAGVVAGPGDPAPAGGRRRLLSEYDLQQHAERGAATINLASGSASGVSTDSSKETMKNAHAWLMVIGW